MAAFCTPLKSEVIRAIQKWPGSHAFKNKGKTTFAKKRSKLIMILQLCSEISVTNASYPACFAFQTIHIVGNFIRCSLSSVKKVISFQEKCYRQFTCYCLFLVSLIFEVASCPVCTHRASYFFF